MVRKTFYLILAFASMFSCLCSVTAKGDIKVRINQPKVRLSIPPGQSKSGQIAIENSADQTVQIKCYLEDWFYTTGGDGGKEFRAASTTPLSCASWVNFSPAEFSIGPYGRQFINYRVNVPSTAEGGHYAVLFFETVIGESQDELGFNVLVLGRIGSLFYIEPEGTIHKEAILHNIEIKPISEKEGFKITAIFRNIGNVDITASGNFNLINEEGLVLARGKFNDAYTFPDDEVTLKALWDKRVDPGIYYLIITLDLGKKTLVEEHRLKFKRGEVEFLK
jgi:hypothetical protein